MIQEKLTIKAINKDYQRLINKWIERQIKYNEIVNVISQKQDLEQSTATLQRNEEYIYLYYHCVTYCWVCYSIKNSNGFR